MVDLATRLQELSPAAKRAFLARLVSVQKAKGKIAPLSYAQQRLWFLEQLVSGNPFYNESSAIRILYPLHTAALEKTLTEIVRRHETLRTIFVATDGQPLQRVLPPQPLAFPIIDLTHLPETERESEALRLVNEHAREPFNIAKGPLLRVSLIRVGSSDHIFVVTMHHIVCDGWSTKVFFDELRELYAAFVYGRSSPLPELPIQYTDFTAWQREWLQGSALEEQLEFWRGRLAGLQTLELPTDKPRPAVPSFSGSREPIAIAPEVNQALESLCEQISVTPFMALLAAFQALLQRYTGQEDVAVGSPVANRNRAELEKLIGFFVNTLVMRTDVSGNPTFRELLRRVREVALSAYSHQDLPFERLVEELQPTRDPSRNPLFQVTFQILEDRESKETIEELRVVEVEQLTSKFDLRCDLWPRAGGLTGYLEYSTDLFEHQTIELMARNFEAMVSAMVADPDRRISSAPLSAGEQEMLREWNNTTRAFPYHGCVHERFEKLADSNHDRLAIVDGPESISYGDLNRRANQLAHYLKRRGIKPGCFVAILLDRSIDLIVSLIATLKAGAAYIPLDPSYPRERLSTMLREPSAPLVLTKSEFAEAVPSFIPHIQIDKNWDAIAKEEVCNLPSHVNEQSLAYVIFTSGSTGKPRGVEVPHSGLNNLVNWHHQEYQITSTDRASVYASPGFDASVWEIWPYLSMGASLHIPDAETHASPSHLASWIAEAGITISFLPTPVAEAFVEMELPKTLRLRILLTGGDKLRHYPPARLPFRFVNHYGPTENTVVATSYTVETSATLNAPPIGKPISNVRVYILDRYGHLAPIGAKGELYLGGAGLARGYLNQAPLTKEKFISTNVDPHLGSRLYRTGDLVRYRSDGNIEFHGRVDCQMKIRGYRVEPGEIEAVLDQYRSIKKSLVTLQENGSGEKALAAYVMSQAAQDADVVASLQAERINEWQQMYEQLYLSNYEERDHSFDIIGWNSSYTGQPLSPAEMEEQVTGTVNRISALGGKSILEIGCGTGLLLLRLAGDCERYVGTDFTKAALTEVEAQVRERNWSHVELYHRRADEFFAEDAQSFDVVVLNSVVQYFPHMDYLAEVLARACGMLRPGGFVFVGDVRSLPLQPLLQAGIEVARADGDCTIEELRARMVRPSISEPELIVDPQFFHALANRVKETSGVAIEVRRGRQQNELTRFRYDVLLQVGPTRSSVQSLSWKSRSWKEFGTIAALRDYLKNTSAALVVTAVPNARLWTEQLKLQKLEQADGNARVSSLKLEDEPAEFAVEPEQLWALEDELGYRIQIGFSEGPDKCACDVKCVPRSLLGAPAILTPTAEVSPDELAKPWSSFGNEVLKQPGEQYMTQCLRQHARQWLPEYMVPSKFIWVAKLPLTTNGKLDRAALPSSNGSSSRSVAPRAAPKTDVEAKVAGIWEEVLGLESVSVNENFFDLGGHSLLLVRLHSKLTQHFETSLSIIDLFRLPSIRSLARALTAEHSNIAATTFI